MSLSSWLTSSLDFFAKSFFKKALTGAGIGIGTYFILQGLYDSALDEMQSNYRQLHDFFYALNMSGVDEGMSIIVSAIGVRIYLKSQGVFLRKISS